MRAKEKKFLFLNRFKTNTHGSFGECACGVMNYDAANEWDEDHKRKLESIEENESVYLQNNAIEFIDIDGSLFVIGCKCKTDQTLFSMLNEHRDQVVRYIKDTQELNR